MDDLDAVISEILLENELRHLVDTSPLVNRVLQTINIGISVDTSEDKYTDSTIGLLNGKEFNVNGDVSVVITQDTSLHFFANRQEIKSKQAGSQTYSTADWSGENKDTVDVYGLGVKHAAIKDKLDIGADISSMRSKGDMSVNTGATHFSAHDQFARHV